MITKKFRLILSLALLGSLQFATHNAFAIPLSVLVGGGSITVGDKLFDNWQLYVNAISGSDSQGRTFFDLTNIDVTGDPGNPLNPGLIFTPLANELTIGQAGGIPVNSQLVFSFDVTVLGKHNFWVDNELAFAFVESAATANDNRSAHIHEFLFTDATLTDLFAEKDVHRILDDGLPIDLIKLSDSATFPPRKSGTVLKDITMEVHSNGELIGITEFTQYFSQTTVPEPATLALFGLGLAGLGWSRRKQAS